MLPEKTRVCSKPRILTQNGPQPLMRSNFIRLCQLLPNQPTNPTKHVWINQTQMALQKQDLLVFFLLVNFESCVRFLLSKYPADKDVCCRRLSLLDTRKRFLIKKSEKSTETMPLHTRGVLRYGDFNNFIECFRNTRNYIISFLLRLIQQEKTHQHSADSFPKQYSCP